MNLFSAYHLLNFFTFGTVGNYNFVNALTSRLVNDCGRGLLTIPIGLGGQGIVDPQDVFDSEFTTSRRITFSTGHVDSSARNVL